MTPKKTQTPEQPAHDRLRTHQDQVRAAVAAYNAAEQAEQEAHAAIEAARSKVREAGDLGLDSTDALAGLAAAKQDAERCGLAREGVGLRVKRAEQARDGYMSENGYALISERRDRGKQITDGMRTCSESLIDLAQQWRQESTLIASYLRALNLTPATNSPAGHGMEPIITDLKRSMQHDLVSPTPHLAARDAAHDEQERVTAMRTEREGAAA